jgi:hypothetical protein
MKLCAPAFAALVLGWAFPAEARAQAHFYRGDVDHSGIIDITDGISILSYSFLGGATPPCIDAADVDDTGEIDIADAVNIFGFLFLGGKPFAAPYPNFEADPTADSLDCLGTPIDITANITASTTWTNDHSYRLVGAIFVKAPAVLTIQAGTTVFGSSTSSPLGLLAVEKGAKIMALGTETSPIVFTSEKPVGQRKKQDWGGILLLGKADLNVAGKCPFVEGLAGVAYGPCADPADENDSSGALSYVRIEYGGFALSPDNEVNGLGMYAVGKGTQLDHIMCKYIADDGFEWFGGAAQLKYAIEVGCTDDMFDTSFGTKGKGQFLIGLQNGADIEASTNGLEMDNSESPVGNFTNDRPLSKPTFANFTLCGPGTPKSASEPGGANGMLIRRNTAGLMYNFIVQGFRSYGVNIDDGVTTNNIDSGDLVVDYGIFYQNGLNTNPAGDGHCQLGQVGPPQEEIPANGFLYSSCSFLTKMEHLLFPTDAPTMNPFNRFTPDWRPQNAGAVASPYDPVVLNSSPETFFESAPYYGAIKPGTSEKDDWSKKPWTSYQGN